MRKSIYKIFAAAFAVVFMTAAAYGATDTAGHWAEGTINQWINRGYIQGYEDGTFRPNNPVTRAEFTALTDRAFSKSGSASAYFSDVNPSDWYYNAVSRGVSAGYISGYGDGTFKPSNNITRQEAAVIIARVLGEGQNAQYANGFSDSYLLSWSKGYVGKCVQLGILKGDPSGSFRPEDSMTRAEAVTALNNALNYYNNNNYAYVPDNQGLVKNDGNDKYRDDGTTTVISSQSYGPNSGKQTLSEPVKITNSSASTRIKNVKFEDTVTVTEDVKSLYLDNITADKLVLNGATYVYLNNSDIGIIEVDAEKAVTIENTSRSGVNTVYLYSKATIYDKHNSSSYGFTNVNIDGSTAKNTNFTLKGGTFSNVTISSEGARLNLSSGTIKNLYLNSGAKNAYVTLSQNTTVNYAEISARSSSVVGSGRISKAHISASDVTLSRRPSTLTGNYSPSYDYYSDNDRDRDYDGRYRYTFSVVNSNGYPVKGADVRVNNTTYSTDSNGEVSFRLDYGRHDYRISHTDFNNRTGTISVTSSNSSGTYTLSGGSKYSMTVTVKDDSGNAVDSAAVRIGGYSGTTDANGIVTITGIESGYYPVSATKNNYSSYSGYAEVSRNSSKSLSVTMKNNTVTTGTLTFTVGKDKDVPNVTGGTITVFESTGAIYLTKGFTFTTSVSFTNLPAGSYTYTITADDYTMVAPTTVTVTAGQTKAVNETMNRVSVSQVTVTVNVNNVDGGAGIEGATVLFVNSVNDQVTFTDTTNDSGIAVLSNVVPGSYNVTISRSGYDSENKVAEINDYRAEQTFTFTMTEETVPTKGTLRVLVTGLDGVIKTAKVSLSGDESRGPQETDEFGYTDFTDLLFDTTYNIEVSHDDYDSNTITGFAFSASNTSATVPMTPKTGTVWIRAVDENGWDLNLEVVFKLYRGVEQVGTYTTPVGDAVKIVDLRYGSYVIKNQSAAGYTAAGEVPFILNDNTNDETVTFQMTANPSGDPLNQGAVAESAEMILPTPQIAVDPVVPIAEAPKAERPLVVLPVEETPAAETPKAEEPKAEEPKTEAPKAERPLVVLPIEEIPAAETPKAETPKVEEPKTETPKAERPLVVLPAEEIPAQETPKAEEPKVETPKVEAPKVEIPKVEEPKAETPNNQNGLVPVNPPVKEAPSIQVNDKRGNDKQEEQRPQQAQTGSIIISVSGPQSATVTIAGQTITVSGTAIINNVPVGSYSYWAYAEGYTSASGSVTVTAGSNTVNINLSQERASVPFNFGETPEFDVRAE